MEQSYEKDKTKEFFRHLGKAYIKYEEKEKAIEKLDEHIEKAKFLSLGKKTPKKKVESEFKKLERQILEVIALERNMLTKSDRRKMSEDFKDRIAELEKKFEKYTDLVLERQKKLKKIEDKIDKRTGDDRKIWLRDKLFDLEEKYHDLKEKGAPASKLKIIEGRIKKLKDKI